MITDNDISNCFNKQKLYFESRVPDLTKPGAKTIAFIFYCKGDLFFVYYGVKEKRFTHIEEDGRRIEI